MAAENNYWDRFSQRRVTRRRMLQGTALTGAGLAAAAVIGCGDEEEGGGTSPGTTTPPASGTTGGTPTRGGVFSWSGSVGQYGHLDSSQAPSIGPNQLALLWGDALLTYQASDMTVTPNVASGYEQPDQTTIVFTLTPNIKFHNKPPVNGRALTAQDVVYTIQRLIEPNTALLQPWRNDFRSVDRIEAPDNSTVRLTMKSPDASLLGTMGHWYAFIAPSEAVDQFTDFKTGEAAISVGPFVASGSWSRDTGGRFERNPEYFKQGMPYFDAVEHITTQTGAITWELVASDRLTRGIVSADEVNQGWDNRGHGLKRGTTGGSTPLNMPVNHNLDKFKDVRVRRALSLFIDRQEIVDFTYFGTPESRPSVAIPGYLEFWNISTEDTERLPWGWDASKKDADYQQANQLLDSAGVTTSNPLRFELMGWGGHPSQGFGEPALAYFQAIYKDRSGDRVQITPRGMEFSTWRDLVVRNEFEAELNVAGTGWEVDHVLSKFNESTGGLNYGRYNDPEMDRLIQRERSIFDTNERKAAVKAIIERIADQVSQVWMATGIENYQVVTGDLRNHHFATSAEHLGIEQFYFEA